MKQAELDELRERAEGDGIIVMACLELRRLLDHCDALQNRVEELATDAFVAVNPANGQDDSPEEYNARCVRALWAIAESGGDAP